jgi:hypothetical protein
MESPNDWKGRPMKRCRTLTAIALFSACAWADFTNPELLVPDNLLPTLPGNPSFVVDASMPTVKRDAQNIDFYVGTSWGISKFWGPISNPFANRDWDRSRAQLFPNRNDAFLATGLNAPYVLGIYVPKTDTYLGIMHVEDFGKCRTWGNYCDSVQYHLGIGISLDKGKTWRYGGKIVDPQLNKGVGSNVGGGAFLVRNGYIYAYFNERVAAGTRNLSVARANVSTVLDNLQKCVTSANPCTQTVWKKFNSNNMSNEGFNEPAFGGAGSNIIPTHPGFPDRPYYDFHSDAVYSSATRKFYITVNVQEYAMLIYASTDGVNWGSPSVVDATPGKNKVYGTFASLSDASDDSRLVGKQFYLIYPRKSISDYFYDDIYRTTVTVSNDVQSAFAHFP